MGGIEKSGDAGEIRLSLYQKKNNLTVQLNQAERLIEAKEEQSSLQKKLEFTTGRYLKARENYLPVKKHTKESSVCSWIRRQEFLQKG